MENVIIGFTDKKQCNIIRDILFSSGFDNIVTCTSGDEILRAAAQLDGGIIICGHKVAGTPYAEIFELMPEGFKMLVILRAKQADSADEYKDDIFYIVLPVSKNDVVKTIRAIFNIDGNNQSKGPEGFSKAGRSGDDMAVIERAKLYLMNKYNVSEESAHRFMQKNSMNSGARMADVARKILSNK